jgi:hypothetical protein
MYLDTDYKMYLDITDYKMYLDIRIRHTTFETAFMFIHTSTYHER